MTSFIALYRGETVSGARLVALTADPRLVQDFAARLIEDDPAEDLRADLRLVDSRAQKTNVRRPAAGLSERGVEDGNQLKGNSAYGHSIPD